MKNTIKVALAGAAITAATLALAPQASATRTWYPTGTAGDQDITLYYNEMTAQGVTGTIPQAWTLEQAACSDLAMLALHSSKYDRDQAARYFEKLIAAQLAMDGDEPPAAS